MVLQKMKKQKQQNEGFLPPSFSETELKDIQDFCSISESFKKNIIQKKTNSTNIIDGEVKNILTGAFPRNFVMNITGLIGRQTGILKSALGIQKAIEYSEKYNLKFDINKHLAFTPTDLSEQVKEYGRNERDIMWVLDERTRTLKHATVNILQNIIESCREKRFCFVLIGVDETQFTISDYRLERLGESDDKYLPNKTVYYVVSKNLDGRRLYRGFYRYNIIPLTDKKWSNFWNNYYMPRKVEYEEKAIIHSLTGIDLGKNASQVIDHPKFDDCFIKGKLNNRYLKTIVYEIFQDRTQEERDLILNKVMLEFGKVDVSDEKNSKV